MPRRGSPYNRAYQRKRAQMLARNAHCRCGAWATEADHYPPVALHPRQHVDGSGCCILLPSCAACARKQGGLIRAGRLRLDLEPDEQVEFLGPDAFDSVWDAAPWLDGLRDVPLDAVWPRLMTAPHPAAVGSYGGEFLVWLAGRGGRPLRWWQQLVAVRILEHDDDGRLVWRTLLLTLARQLGKSWLLRELFMWRIEQGARFGEPQLVLHTGKDVAVCKEVQRQARIWARLHPDLFRVREVNGQEEIELIADGSRWMLRARNAVYGYSASVAGVDEAWAVAAAAIEDGLEPTMVERSNPQLWLVSTAHRRATPLFPARRVRAASSLWTPDRVLLVEWSPPLDADRWDPDAWRAASPHWTADREELVADRLAAAEAGRSDDPDDPDPMESFDSQWLNRWRPGAGRAERTQLLLPEGRWADLGAVVEADDGPVWVAVEDNYGQGAAVAVAQRRRDGRYELDGWLCESWEQALADAVALRGERRARLLIGATLSAKVPDMRPVPERVGTTETRQGLAVLRDLAASGAVVHDVAPALDEQLERVRVREGPVGLILTASGRTDLVRAAVWALVAAHRRPPTASIH